MNVRSIAISTAAFAFAVTTMHAAPATATANAVVVLATATPAAHHKKHKPRKLSRPKPMMVKAIAPSHPGPQAAVPSTKPMP